MRRTAMLVGLAFSIAAFGTTACGGDGAGDGDAGTGADTDTDSDADTDADTDTDSDSDSDNDSDSETETDTLWDTACTVGLSGECVELVAGCAWCPDGSSVWPENMDCGDATWCCVPEIDPTNGCQTAGGVCAPGSCPTGWVETEGECAEDIEFCCVAGDSCA